MVFLNSMSSADISGYGGLGGCSRGNAWQHRVSGNWTTLMKNYSSMNFFEE